MSRIAGLTFPRHTLPPTADALRAEVRQFLAAEDFEPKTDGWLAGHDPQFSRRLAAAGLVGVTIPRRYGGRGLTWLERFVIAEEVLAAGAPVAAHWHAERQVAPLLLRYGTEAQRARFLPAIARAECLVCIGMSEPGAGSDLAAVRTRARPTLDGYVLDGQKVWTSHAHRSDYMLTLCRTGDEEDRHAGLSQILVDLRSPGVEIRPIRILSGNPHFAEVLLTSVRVPYESLVGKRGDGWRQVVAELGFERSGPERILTTFPLLGALLRDASDEPSELYCVAVGRLLARLSALRGLAMSVAGALDNGSVPATEAAVIKDMGTRFEQDVVEAVRSIIPLEPRTEPPAALERALEDAILAAPGFTLRGGSTEILRGVVARAVVDP